MEKKKARRIEIPQTPHSLMQTVEDLVRTDELAIERAKISVAETIFCAMRQREVSKAELARRMGKSRAHVTQILRGDANFTLDSLVRISTALDSRLEMHLLPNRLSAHWSQLHRNRGIESIYPRWGNCSEYTRPTDVSQPIDPNEALITVAA
jgi:plasmid maintenance system antidote protein VapI